MEKFNVQRTTVERSVPHIANMAYVQSTKNVPTPNCLQKIGKNDGKYERIFVIQAKKNLFDTSEIKSRIKKFTYQKKYTTNFRCEKTY